MKRKGIIPSGTIRPLCAGLLAGLACTLMAPVAQAYDDEIRVGAVVQVPISFGSSAPALDPGKIRVGMTCQYAGVQEDRMLGYTLADSGDEVIGLEGNIYTEPFGNWNPSAEILGFYGSNKIQGAAGVGYSLSDALFVDVKARFPYSEVGLRFMNHPEIYGGASTFGEFRPAKKPY